MSTHTERCCWRKSSGAYGHGIRLNQVNRKGVLPSVSRPLRGVYRTTGRPCPRRTRVRPRARGGIVFCPHPAPLVYTRGAQDGAGAHRGPRAYKPASREVPREQVPDSVNRGGSSMAAFKLISSDSHVYEPQDLWTSRMPPQFRGRAPHVVSRADGDWWYCDNH